ncbi:MAG: PDZ domain-containing protein [Candidatus Binataceae bacterium]|nr:PDZ domain-containing protein [Candidatus Binataceae bacterium]
MRSRQFIALAAIFVAALSAGDAALAHAQSGVGGAGPARVGTNLSGDAPVPPLPPGAADSTNDGSDQTLEIAPRIPAPPPPASASTPAVGNSGAAGDASAPDDASGAPDTSTADLSGGAPADGTAAEPQHPYLGVAVQTIFSDDQPGRVITGLEVVSVDPGSPAQQAGLLGRTQMTSVGASGATAGALIPPLDLLMMPLLKKAGSLGKGGDLIVAVDDRRVTNDLDLQDELAALKPGDVIYLTIERAAADGTKRTLKLPVKLTDGPTATPATSLAARTPSSNAAAKNSQSAAVPAPPRR